MSTEVWCGFSPSVSVGLFNLVGLGVLERGREGLDTDFGGEAEVGGGKLGGGGGDEGLDSNSDVNSASGRRGRGICVNSADVADGTRCAVEQARVFEDEVGFGLDDTGTVVRVRRADEEDGIRWAVEEANVSVS